ncbi:MAG: phosphatidylserine decarboxylase [Chlorobiaceae bacterium]|nr:phosphatidylserine decarboxylase [Chlorobiaceae bacterium]NTW11516.1 phosphatidylserine decarboxylase [Chlorobiaceae bacterium]
MLTPYGYNSIRKAFILCLVLDLFSMLFPDGTKMVIMLLSTLLLGFTFWFFRDPERNVPEGEGQILAPADGRIILVRQCDNEFTGNGSTLVSIFMSPFNVHVNRIPMSGRVTRLRYHQGKFLMAFDKRSLESNEKMEIGIDNGRERLLFCQVSGFLARRIVCTLEEGARVKTGSRFGMIRFGSRVDLILPPGAAVTVREGQKTLAGETLLARL